MVQCSTCGYLAVENRLDATTTEADEKARQEAQRLDPAGRYKRARLYCYALSSCFPKGEMHTTKDLADAINCQIECRLWTEWLKGRSPQEHLKMQELKDQRDHNDRMLAEERCWREGQAEREHQWKREEREAREAESSKVATRFWIGLAFLMLVTIVGQSINGCVQYMLRQHPATQAQGIVSTGDPAVMRPAP